MSTKPNKPNPRRRQQRAITRNQIQQLLRMADEDDNAARECVGPREAMQLSTYFACIRNISEDCAKLPLILYEQNGEERTRATGDPLYKLLRDEPNADMTAFTLRSVATAHAVGWGNGYIEIERTGTGRPFSLYPLYPEDVTPVRVNGKIIYEVRIPGMDVVPLEARNVIHISGLGYDGIIGYSPAYLARQSLGVSIASQKFVGSFYGNGTALSGAIEHPGKLTPKALENLRASFSARHSGSKNAFKTMILEEGMKYQSMGIPPGDAQLVESRQFEVEDICRWFRMPPHKVGHLLRAQGWSTLEQTNMDYLTDTLMPWLVRWEQEINRKLVQGENQYTEHLVEALLRSDTTGRYAAYRTAIEAGFMSRNEARVRENLNPVEGLDEFIIPANMQTSSSANGV